MATMNSQYKDSVQFDFAVQVLHITWKMNESWIPRASTNGVYSQQTGLLWRQDQYWLLDLSPGVRLT